VSLPVATLIATALAGHNVYAAGEAVTIADATYCLGQLNSILDAWNADGQSSIADVFTSFVCTPSLQPHTVGPTGTVVLPVRPVTIDGASLSVGTGLWVPIHVHLEPGWWLAQSVVANASVTDLYYAPTVPNGEIYFSGVPTSALTVRIMTRTVLASVLLTQSLTLAPGYELALTLTLQEAIADAFHATVSATLQSRAGKARGVIWQNNLRVPSLSSGGQGLPGSDGGWFDYRTYTWKPLGTS
jgi:hypothetical protein